MLKIGIGGNWVWHDCIPTIHENLASKAPPFTYSLTSWLCDLLKDDFTPTLNISVTIPHCKYEVIEAIWSEEHPWKVNFSIW